MEYAIVDREVPAILSPTRRTMKVGTKVEFKRLVFRNGEHHLVLKDGKQVPSVFFKYDIDRLPKAK